MTNQDIPQPLSTQEAEQLIIKAGQVFQPRAPINNRDLFSGRWEQLKAVADAVNQSGLHIVIFGERGVGKTSLANVIDPLLAVMEEEQAAPGVTPKGRLVVKVNANHGDSFSDIWKRAF